MDAFAFLSPPALAVDALHDYAYIPFLHALLHDDDLYQLKLDRLHDFLQTVKTSPTNYFFMDWVGSHYMCGLVLENTQRHRDEALAYGLTDYITWECPRDPVTPVHPLTLINNLWSTQAVNCILWNSIVHRPPSTCIRKSLHPIPLNMITELNTIDPILENPCLRLQLLNNSTEQTTESDSDMMARVEINYADRLRAALRLC